MHATKRFTCRRSCKHWERGYEEVRLVADQAVQQAAQQTEMGVAPHSVDHMKGAQGGFAEGCLIALFIAALMWGVALFAGYNIVW